MPPHTRTHTSVGQKNKIALHILFGNDGRRRWETGGTNGPLISSGCHTTGQHEVVDFYSLLPAVPGDQERRGQGHLQEPMAVKFPILPVTENPRARVCCCLQLLGGPISRVPLSQSVLSAFPSTYLTEFSSQF